MSHFKGILVCRRDVLGSLWRLNVRAFSSVSQRDFGLGHQAPEMGTTLTTRLFVCSLFCWSLAAVPLSARPVTHEDIWTLRRIGNPQVSPDGKWAVVSVQEPDYDKEKQVSDLWLVPTDGGKSPRRLTATSGPESGVSWSRQSDRIVFTAKRGKDESQQLYLLDMRGPGEAQKVGDFPLDCANPQFTPDGRSIVFEAQVYPGKTDPESQKEAKKSAKDRKEQVSSYDSFPIRHWDHWLDGRHPRPYIVNLNDPGRFRDLLANQVMVEKKGFAGVPGLASESLQCAISPDGKDLLFVATTNRDESVRAVTTYRLYKVALAGGEVSEVPGPTGSIFSPVFGSEGKLYTTYEPHNDWVYNLLELRVQDWPVKGSSRSLTAGSDLSVEEFVVSAAGKVVFSADVHGRRRLYTVAEGSVPTPIDGESRGVFGGIGLASDGIITRYEDGTVPSELVKVDWKGKKKNLSAFNTSRVKDIDWSPYEEFWFTSSAGRKIHSWVVLPPGYSKDGKYPLVLSIHGGPHSTSHDSGHTRWSPQLLAAGGYIVLMTDYSGSVGYGAKFAQAIQGDPLKTPGQEILEAVEEAVKRYPAIDESKVAATGASYGGHLVNWFEATTTRFTCLISHAGLVSLEGQWATSDAVYHRERNLSGPPWGGNPIWREQSPSNYVDNFKTPIMLTIGEKDYRVPINETLAAWTYLQRMGVPGKLHVYHQANHWVMAGPDAKHYWEEVHKWLAEHLK